MSLPWSHRTTAAGLAAIALAASTLAVGAGPADAADPDPCTTGSTTSWNYQADEAQHCRTPGSVGSSRYVSVRVSRMYGGGGGGGAHDPYEVGGDSGRINFDLSVPEGADLDLYVANGGSWTDADPDRRGDGAGGGGSTAIVFNGVVLAEAGGGGGAQNSAAGGSPDGQDPRRGLDGAGACGGQGGNQDLAGTGGIGGPVDSQQCPDTGGVGYPITGGAGGDGWTGDGGAGAPFEVGAGEAAGTGGFGWSWGGNGGAGYTEDVDHSGGSGGGGGYGDAGGGASNGGGYDLALGTGGAGGSNVRPIATASTPEYDIRSTGGYEDDGDPGQIRFAEVGPAVVTEAAAPTDVTGETATTHSTVDANSDVPISETRVEYSTDPDFATGVQSVPGDPATLPGEIGDKPVSAGLTGLSPGTVYYYRIVAFNGTLTTAGKIESFQTPMTISGITPDSGPEAGGTTVTITGTGFREGTSVSIGGVPCAPVTIVSSTQLTCKTGAHPAETVDVVVSNDGPGNVSATLPAAYTYLPSPTPPSSGPSITAVAPGSGPTTGGTQLHVTGSGFEKGATITVGGVPCTPVTFVSATKLTCTTGAHSAGTVDVVVTNPSGESATDDQAFTYVPGVVLRVRSLPAGKELSVGTATHVVHRVTTNGKHRINAFCTANGHRLKRACSIRVQERKGKVTAVPMCNDHVHVVVRVVAVKKGTRETWTRHWRVDATPRVTCKAHANG